MYFYFLIGFILALTGIDFYFYRSMRHAIKGKYDRRIVPNWLRYLYWGFTVFTVVFLLVATYYYLAKVPPPKFARTYIVGMIMISLLSKLTGVLFFVIGDLKEFLHWLYLKIKGKPVVNERSGRRITRASFIKQTGLIASGIPFISLTYGIKSAFDFSVLHVVLKSPDLPKSFDGYRITQVSDIHSGSFISKSPLKNAVKMINEQNADVIFFTGDLVNEVAEEALPFIGVLKNIRAPDGVYSILGNHDYGDYFYREGDDEGRKHNYSLIRNIHEQLGWDLLLNEHRSLSRKGEEIGLVGVENWGSSARFQKYGDLNKARMGMTARNFNILLSHDPSHWDAKTRPEHGDIGLTLSGHTHGFQMGIEIPGYVKWSPSQYLYEEWAGLYRKDRQWLYVNRGLGFLGYPGRLGILPEITVIELRRS